MSKKRSDFLLLNDILDSISKIEEYLAGYSEEDFYNDQKTKDAVVRNFEIMGEASRRTGEDLKSQNPLVNWRDISDFRNKMIHDYFGVDYVVVWETVQFDLPDLKQKIQTVINHIPAQ